MSPTLQRTTDATFGRHVLASPRPVLALFGAPRCAASRATALVLQELAASYAGAIGVTSVDTARDMWLAEQYGVAATPTILVAQAGEIVTRVIGYVPAALLRLLCEQAADGTLPPDPFWSPTEATFEDLVLLPLLAAWNFTAVRQAACSGPSRGRIDVLVYDGQGEPPLTLFENKRQLLSAQALRQAVGQADRYAQALELGSFVVAAPAGLWIYARSAEQVVLVRQITSLELEQQPGMVPELLRRLRR